MWLKASSRIKSSLYRKSKLRIERKPAIKPALISIAIVNNNEIERIGMKLLLSSTDAYDILFEAKTGTELIEQLEEAPYLPLICLLDIGGENSNLEALQRLKEKCKKIRVLVLSDNVSDELIAKAIKYGTNGYLQKNSTIDELFIALSDISNKNYYYSKLTPQRLFDAAKHHNVNKIAKQGTIKSIEITEQKKRLLCLFCQNLTYSQIAAKMNIAPRTVDGHREALFKQFRVSNRASLVIAALKEGVIQLQDIDKSA